MLVWLQLLRAFHSLLLWIIFLHWRVAVIIESHKLLFCFGGGLTVSFERITFFELCILVMFFLTMIFFYFHELLPQLIICLCSVTLVLNNILLSTSVAFCIDGQAVVCDVILFSTTVNCIWSWQLKTLILYFFWPDPIDILKTDFPLCRSSKIWWKYCPDNDNILKDDWNSFFVI